MKRQWEIEKLEGYFTLLPSELAWLDPNPKSHNRLGQAIQLKVFQYESRFPESRRDAARQVAEFISQQLNVNITELDQYNWTGRSARNHRQLVRDLLGFRPITAADQTALHNWLLTDVVTNDHRLPELTQAAYAHLRQLHLEPPTRGRLTKIIQTVRRQYELAIFQKTAAALSEQTKAKLQQLITVETTIDDNEDSEAAETMLLHELKTGYCQVDADCASMRRV